MMNESSAENNPTTLTGGGGRTTVNTAFALGGFAGKNYHGTYKIEEGYHPIEIVEVEIETQKGFISLFTEDMETFKFAREEAARVINWPSLEPPLCRSLSPFLRSSVRFIRSRAV